MESSNIFSDGIDLEGRLDLLTPRVKKESYYQTLIENILGGSHQYIKRIGFTDVTIHNAHIEIKDGPKYHQACGQLLKYHLVCPRDHRVVILFGRLPVSLDFLRTFFSHTIATHVLYFDSVDNLHPIYRGSDLTSPYFRKSPM